MIYHFSLTFFDISSLLFRIFGVNVHSVQRIISSVDMVFLLFDFYKETSTFTLIFSSQSRSFEFALKSKVELFSFRFFFFFEEVTLITLKLVDFEDSSLYWILIDDHAPPSLGVWLTGRGGLIYRYLGVPDATDSFHRLVYSFSSKDFSSSYF